MTRNAGKAKKHVSREAQELEVIDPNGGRPKTLEEECYGWGTDEDGRKRLDLEIHRDTLNIRGTLILKEARLLWPDKEHSGWWSCSGCLISGLLTETIQVQHVPQAGAGHDANALARPSAASWNQIHCWMDGGKIAGEATWWWYVENMWRWDVKFKILLNLEVTDFLFWIFRVHRLLWYLLDLRMRFRDERTKEIWDRSLPSRLGRWLFDWFVCRLEQPSGRVQICM